MGDSALRYRNSASYPQVSRVPDLMSVLGGPGGDGELLTLRTIGKSICGSGRAVAPSSILQNGDAFRRQGRLYMGILRGAVGE